MLPQKHRVSKNLFPLLKKNRLVEGEVFSLRVSFGVKVNNEPIGVKTACIISKKVEKSAVKRNRMKRQVYSILKTQINRLTPGIVLQIFPKKVAFTKKFADLENELLTTINNSIKK